MSLRFLEVCAYDENGRKIVCPTCKVNNPRLIIEGKEGQAYLPCYECEPPKVPFAQFVYRPSEENEPVVIEGWTLDIKQSLENEPVEECDHCLCGDHEMMPCCYEE